MFTLKIENPAGEIFELTHNTQSYVVIGVQGLTPPPTNVNTSVGGLADGTFFNSARLDQRNIVIDIVLQGDIETNRQQLYRIFPRKLPCTVYFSNRNRDVKIIGYVEMLDGDLFSMRERMQVSIICPRPYFEALQTIYTELSRVVRMFEFPFSIEDPVTISEIAEFPLCTITNDGDVEAGLTISVSVITTTDEVRIFNSTAGNFIGFSNSFEAGDEITICTSSGSLSAVLNRGGNKTNLLNALVTGSSWIRLVPGENLFTFTSAGGSDSIRIVFAFSELYGGV